MFNQSIEDRGGRSIFHTSCSSQSGQYYHCGMRLEKSRVPISGSKKGFWSELFEGVVGFDQEEKRE